MSKFHGLRSLSAGLLRLIWFVLASVIAIAANIHAFSTRTVTIDDVSGAEGGQYSNVLFRFSVTLAGDPLVGDEAVSLNYATEDVTARAGLDYQAVSGTLIFSAGSPRVQQIVVPIIGENVPEPDELFKLNLTNLTGPAALVRTFGFGEINGDDPVPIPYEGDVVDDNGGPGIDTQILSNDLTALRRFVVGTAVPLAGSSQFQRADINIISGVPCGNGVLDAGDVSTLRQIILGTIESAPACGPVESVQ